MNSILAKILLLICAHLQITSSIRFNFRQSSPKFDPYATLSLHPTATPAQIQKAYRLKARETHPDKNPSPNANEEFRRVSEAFDILSDPAKKRMYDEQRRREQRLKEEQRRREQRAREEQRRRDERRWQAEQWEREQALIKKREMIQKAKAGYGRVLKWSKLSQLEDIAVDHTTNVFTTNLLVMFVGNKAAERKGEEEYYFPYPFIETSKENNDLLIVAKVSFSEVYLENTIRRNNIQDLIQLKRQVRYNAQTPLTQRFRAQSKSDNPYFVFAKKGNPLHYYHVYHPKRHHVDIHEDWKHWVQSLLLIRGVIANRHPLPVDIFIIRDGRIEQLPEQIKSGFEIELNLHPNDRIVVFDSRLDNFPGGRRYNNEKIVQYSERIAIFDTIVSSETEYVIHPKRCYDLSTQCFEWSMTIRGRPSQCYQNPEFMHNICPYTCGVCSDSILSDVRYLLFHYPEHKLPFIIRGLVQIIRILVEDDTVDVFQIEKSSAAVFLVIGLLLAFNIVFFETATKSSTSSDARNESNPKVTRWDISILILTLGICYGLRLFVSFRGYMVPKWLAGFHRDFSRVASETDMYIWLILGGILAYVYVTTVITFMMNENINTTDIIFFIAIMASSVVAVLSFVFLVVGKNSNTAIRWSHLWDYRKNAAFVFIALGSLVGASFTPFQRVLRHVIMAENFGVLMIPNLFVIGGIACLTNFDPNIYSDLTHTINSNKIAVLVLVFFGVILGLLYMKLIDMLASEDVTDNDEKVKVD